MAKKSKKDKFANMGKKILNPEKPHDLGSFLSDDEKENRTETRKTVNTDSRNSVKPETRKEKPKPQKKVREEFQFPADLSERLRKRAFEDRKTKVAIVIEALEKHLT